MTALALAPDPGISYEPGAAAGADRAIRVSTAIAVLAVAGVAAYVSYWHAYAVVCAHGETGVLRGWHEVADCVLAALAVLGHAAGRPEEGVVAAALGSQGHRSCERVRTASRGWHPGRRQRPCRSGRCQEPAELNGIDGLRSMRGDGDDVVRPHGAVDGDP